jgi:hypothetical protein
LSTVFLQAGKDNSLECIALANEIAERRADKDTKRKVSTRHQNISAKNKAIAWVKLARNWWNLLMLERMTGSSETWSVQYNGDCQ